MFQSSSTIAIYNSLINTDRKMSIIRKPAWLFAALFVILLLTSCAFGFEILSNQTARTYGDSIDPFLLFEELRGRRVITGGWADYANSGQGVSYADPAYPIIINDALFPDPIAKFEAFVDALGRQDQHVFIIVSGDIDLSRGRITDAPGHVRGLTDVPPYGPSSPFVRMFDISSSNTTIIGINNARIMFGGLQIDGRQNIIIRNLTFWDARDTRRRPGLDHLRITGDGTIGIWIDHCKFSSGLSNHRAGGDWHDTLLNIPGGEVTVSWNEFTNANEVLLVGSGNSGEFSRRASEDELLQLRSRRRVTLHHNYFHSARYRMPRTRGTQMHIYNNFFTNIWWHVMSPGLNAHFVVQNNYFDPVRYNALFRLPWNSAVHGAYRTAGAVVWYSGNVGEPLSWRANAHAGLVTNPAPKPWNPLNFYSYNLTDDVQSLRALIPSRAGPTLGTIEDFLTNFRD